MPKVDFVGQKDGEKLLFIFRTHPVGLTKGYLWLFFFIILGALPMFFWGANIQFVLIFLAALTLGLIFFFYRFLLWYFSIYIVTSDRVRIIRQSGLFTKTVTDIDLSSIESIECHIKGLFSNLFRYGTIVVSTRSSGQYSMPYIRDAEGIQSRLQSVFTKERKETL